MGQQKRLLLLVGLGGAAALFGILIFLSARNHSDSPKVKPEPTTSIPPKAAPNENVPLVPYGGGISVAVTHRQLVERGDEYGHKGEWQKAFECFRELVASGNSVEYEWGCATGSALAAGDTNACERLCLQMMDTFGKSNNAANAERFAKQCLALPHCSDELLEQATDRADYVIKKNRNNPWGQLVQAMAEYRRGNWSAALEWLRQLEKSGDMDYAVMAWCFGAMARHHLGDAAGARKALEQVNSRVKALVCMGKLGSWNDIARAIGVRAEAEQLILGKKVSPPLDSSELVQNREKWKSVAYDLNAGDQMGKQFQWVPAAGYYARVMQDPVFDWTVSEVNQDLVCQKMAAVFLLAGDQTRYCDLVRALLARKVEYLSPTMQERYAQIFVSNTELLTPELKAQGVAYARRLCDDPEAGNSPWMRLLRGETDYRERHFDTAIQTLSQVSFPPAESDGAARVMIYKAMAYKQLGRTEDALEATQAANALFARQTARSGDWTNPAFYQLGMKELLGMLASTSEPKKNL